MEDTGAQAELCRWFATLFARELTGAQLAALQRNHAAPLIDALWYFLGDSAEVKVLSEAIARLALEDRIESRLATDYAALFLMPGRQTAPPFASCYAAPGLLFGPAHQDMQERLSRSGLAPQGPDRLPADHIAIMLEYLAACHERRAGADDPEDFIVQAFRPWITDFTARTNSSPAGRRLYGPVAKALAAFLTPDERTGNSG